MKMIFIDIDTQFDFMKPDGCLYVKDAETIIENLRKLTEYAVRAGIPIVSTMDTHTKDDPEFKDFPPHCISGTKGHEKIEETIVNNIIMVNSDDSEKILQYDYMNWCFLKTSLDAFSHPLFEKFIERFRDQEMIVYGVATDYCVKLLSLGLLKRKFKVTIVENAIKGVAEGTTKEALLEMKSKGATFKRTEAIIT